LIFNLIFVVRSIVKLTQIIHIMNYLTYQASVALFICNPWFFQFYYVTNNFFNHELCEWTDRLSGVKKRHDQSVFADYL